MVTQTAVCIHLSPEFPKEKEFPCFPYEVGTVPSWGGLCKNLFRRKNSFYFSFRNFKFAMDDPKLLKFNLPFPVSPTLTSLFPCMVMISFTSSKQKTG